MFNKLKDKLKNWMGKSEETETPKKEEKTEKKRKEKHKEKKTKEKSEKKTKEKKETPKPEKTKEKKIPTEEELKQQADNIKEQIPEKFETGKLKYEPDIEKPAEKKEEPEVEEQKPKKSFFSKFSKSFTAKRKITQEDIDEIFDELELILLENNVALETLDKIKENLTKELLEKEVEKKELEETIVQTLKDSISNVLLEAPDLIKEIKEKPGPYIILFFGINGSGKTTSLAKLAHLLKKNGISVIMTAGDTFRAASIEQLEKHGENLGIKVIKQDYNTDPTAVAFDAKKYAEKNNIKCVLIDTAGRMYTKENLIKQMEKLIRVIKPDKKIFVGESITGNDAIQQARTFNEALDIDGIILTKADIDEKGGTILSVSHTTGKPIYFLGVGQEYKDLQKFEKKDILKKLGL